MTETKETPATEVLIENPVATEALGRDLDNGRDLDDIEATASASATVLPTDSTDGVEASADVALSLIHI